MKKSFVKLIILIIALTLTVSFFIPLWATAEEFSLELNFNDNCNFAAAQSESFCEINEERIQSLYGVNPQVTQGQSFNGIMSGSPQEQDFDGVDLDFPQVQSFNNLASTQGQSFNGIMSGSPQEQDFDGVDLGFPQVQSFNNLASTQGQSFFGEYLGSPLKPCFNGVISGSPKNQRFFGEYLGPPLKQSFNGVISGSPKNQRFFGEYFPWDCELTLSCGKLTYHYKLSENIENLSPQSKQSRAIYSSAKLKKQRIEELVGEGYSYYQAVYYVLPNIHKIIEDISKKLNKPAVDATVIFKKDAFTYTAEQKGRYMERESACIIIFRELARQKTIELPLVTLNPKITQQFLKDHTLLRGTFSTDFSSSGKNRAANIRLALSSLNGLIVIPEERVSFNAAVGPRTRERGYAEAKIIMEGEYVSGVGGGVCQVSTTLYNALLLSDVQVLRRAPHSLISSYVLPSFDAMVNSASSDLIFYNNTGHTLFVSAYTEKGRAVIKFYGAPNVYRIVRKSEIISKTPREEKIFTDTTGKYADKVTYDTDLYILSQGSDGIVSKGKLLYYKGDNLIKVKELARDTYKASPRIIVKGALPFPALTESKVKKPLLP